MSIRKTVIASLATFVLVACSKTPEQAAGTYQSHLEKITTIEEIEKECSALKTAAIKLHKEQDHVLENNPLFTLVGEVKGREEFATQIWGRAYVANGGKHWASGGEERNIVVVNPKDEFNGANFYKGYHYFVKKDSGKNALGADVPIWIFGPPPPELAEALAKKEEMDQKGTTCLGRKLELVALAQKEKSSSLQEQGQSASGNSGQNQQIVAMPPEPINTAASPAPTTENFCENPTTDFDLRQCASEKFDKLDRELNQLYKSVMARLTPDLQVRLKREQIVWIRKKEAECNAPDQYGEKGYPAWMLNSIGCQMTETQRRMIELKAIGG